MTPKELPDRIRPLEGAGLTIMALNMGVEKKRDRWPFIIMGAVLVIGAVFFAVVW